MYVISLNTSLYHHHVYVLYMITYMLYSMLYGHILHDIPRCLFPTSSADPGAKFPVRPETRRSSSTGAVICGKATRPDFMVPSATWEDPQDIPGTPLKDLGDKGVIPKIRKKTVKGRCC